MKKKLVIFDFDGTLADTRKTIVAAKQEAMRKLGLPVLSEEECASSIGLTAPAGFRKCYPDLPEETIAQCVAVYREIFDELKVTMPPELFPGVKEVLEELKAHGVVCTIATSRHTDSMNEFLEKLGLRGCFSYALGGNDTARLKPDPDPVLKTLRDLGIAADETIVIGDMPYDIEMGKRAGVQTCGVTYGNADRETLLKAGADFVIDEITELPALL
ncbi:MAG: HAD family hydrolase [Lachnospiraceae bacterium]|nr:HAD family hydrolase [Lachnospiraceae bacterium]